MVTLLRSEALEDPESPPDFWNPIENMTADFLNQHGVLPRYLYMNTTAWADTMTYLLPMLEKWNLEVVYHHSIPYDRMSLHYNYTKPEKVGKMHNEFSNEEGLESGRLAME